VPHLRSREAAFVTGENIAINGGHTGIFPAASRLLRTLRPQPCLPLDEPVSVEHETHPACRAPADNGSVFA
jgi:hypothetical protein